MIILIAIVFAFGAIICYASCVAAARADKHSEDYWSKKNGER